MWGTIRVVRFLLPSLLLLSPAVDALNPVATGTWTDVTPSSVSLNPDYGGNGTNFGVETVGADTGNPGTVYFMAHNQGVWKSADYGQTWRGPINTGKHGSDVTQCGGGITVVSNGSGVPATIWEGCIRYSVGMWKSTDGGVNWASVTIPRLPSGFSDIYPPVVDPNNTNHLLVEAHEQPYLLETTNGGKSFHSIALAPGMTSGCGTAQPYFINNGDPAFTAQTWLWVAQQCDAKVGTWRTTNAGASWTKVDNNEHPHGAEQIYQPDTNGVMYMAGSYSTGGWGVQRSTDYGVTWNSVGAKGAQTVVWGTPSRVYSMFGWSINGSNAPGFQSAPQPGTSWSTASSTPANFTGGPHSIAVLYDGTHYIFVGGMGLSGVWRYVE